MALTGSRLAYSDCEEIFDRALEDSKGVRVEVKDFNTANHLRMRMQYFRKLDRNENAQTYETGHPMHGRSRYDILTVRFREEDDKWWVYVMKIELQGKIEGLGEPVPAPQPPEKAPEPEVPDKPSSHKFRRLSV